jgi:hypothetical protein
VLLHELSARKYRSILARQRKNKLWIRSLTTLEKHKTTTHLQMSVRSEPTSMSATAQMAGMEIASTSLPVPNDHVSATISAAQSADSALGDANSLSTNHPDHPLRRTFVTSIRATLGDLCLRKTKGTWAPSPEALKSALQ